MRSRLPERSPETWRIACLEMAQRAESGGVLYPFIAAFLLLSSSLWRTRPAVSAVIMILVALIALGRHLLIRRFESIYDRSPRLWQIGFFGGLLATCGLVSALFYLLVIQQGLTPLTWFTLALAVGLASMAIIVYSHALAVILIYVSMLWIPLVVALFQLEASGSWIGWMAAAAVGYLFLLAGQQHRERWGNLTSRYRLAARTSESERARDELARLIHERTAALERTSQEYRQIFESAHDAIIIFRPKDEQVLNVNRRACEIYGFSREEFLRISLAAISEDVPRGQQQILETLEGGVYHNFESVQRRKDGSRMFLEINASRIDYEGRPAILSINRDVTERRRAAELRLAKEAAEHAAQTKTQFLANMSHEIRTPMAGVVGLADLLLATALDERQAQYVRLIQSSAVSLLRIIDDILDFTKIEAGKLTFEESTFDLIATLQQVIELLRLGAAAKGTSLRLELAADLPRWVRGDPARLRQVLINLIGNAVKFTDEGKVEVRAERDADGRLHLRVHDTGIGIPVEVQGKIFEIFSQADGSTSRRYGGTGLGLAISKRIVEGMGGKIGFDSTPGQGSTFWITLDLPLAAAPAPEPPAVSGARAQRILTAEDNPVNQLVISEHLKALGYEVVAVGDGLEALATLDTADFDLVLMDCQMPNLDGYEATRRIRQLPDRKAAIPIIALTAHALREDLDRCLAAGMNDTLTKPFQVETLQRKIERWLGTGPERETEPRTEPASRGPEESSKNRQLELLHEIGRTSGPAYVSRLIEQYRLLFDRDELREALAKGDNTTVQRRIHSLKGASSLFGADGLSRLCRQLEIQCGNRNRNEAECLLLLDLIGSEHGRVLERLHLVFETVSSGR
jgi:PAS domain S-box-containing protein